jgi:hypothetical protein
VIAYQIILKLCETIPNLCRIIPEICKNVPNHIDIMLNYTESLSILPVIYEIVPNFWRILSKICKTYWIVVKSFQNYTKSCQKHMKLFRVFVSLETSRKYVKLYWNCTKSYREPYEITQNFKLYQSNFVKLYRKYMKPKNQTMEFPPSCHCCCWANR